MKMYIFQRKEKTEEVHLKQTDLEIQAGVISPNLNCDHFEISFRKNASHYAINVITRRR